MLPTLFDLVTFEVGSCFFAQARLNCDPIYASFGSWDDRYEPPAQLLVEMGSPELFAQTGVISQSS
jgi:hypothetical protein